MLKRCLAIAMLACMLLGLLCGCGNYSDDLNIEPDSTTELPHTSETETVQASNGETDSNPVETITLSKNEVYLKTAGETYTVYDGNIPVGDITWGSENAAVATFANGVITAIGSGETTVYAEYNGVRATCLVNCDLKQTTNNGDTGSTGTGNSDTGNGGSTGSTGGSRDPVKSVPAAVVDASFFDDAVFIGDSISLKLSQYASGSGELGKAKFLVIGSYGVSNAINDHPDTKLSFRGTTYTDFEEALAATGGKKVFIMLGMNDIGLYGIDKTIENWGIMISMIHEKCPDMEIFIQSMTPVWTGGEKGKLNNENVNKYNEQLKIFAESNGYKFIDVAPYMKDTTGGLATKFCSDSYVHLTNEGAQTWIKVLKAYTGY